MTTPTAPPQLAPDLEYGLKRLKLKRIRELAPEPLPLAKTQRWAPEELLHTLVEAQIQARDKANLKARTRAAGFPQEKQLEHFKIAQSSIPQPTFDYLAEWIPARACPLMIGPADTGKSHCLIGLGHATAEAGMRVRHLRADELVELLYPGLADNTVGKVIDTPLRNDYVVVDELGFAPLDETDSQPLFRFVAPAYKRRSVGVANH